MEGGGNFGANHPIRVGDLTNAFDSIAVLDHRHQTVIGQHEELSALGFHDHSLARTADAGIHDRHKHRSSREIGRCAKQEASAVASSHESSRVPVYCAIVPLPASIIGGGNKSTEEN